MHMPSCPGVYVRLWPVVLSHSPTVHFCSSVWPPMGRHCWCLCACSAALSTRASLWNKHSHTHIHWPPPLCFPIICVLIRPSYCAETLPRWLCVCLQEQLPWSNSASCPHMPWDVLSGWLITNWYMRVRMCVSPFLSMFVHAPGSNAIQGTHSALASSALTVARDINIDHCPVNTATQLGRSQWFLIF